jgi:hypothetical protein
VSGHALSCSTRKQPDRAHVAYMPVTAWPVNGRPPGSIPRPLVRPGFGDIRICFDTSSSDHLPDPYLTHQVRLFPHRSPRQSSANAAVGGLKPPPAGRLRRAYLHLPCSTASRSPTYIGLLSAFRTQAGSPRAFQPGAPTDPCVNLSIYTAPVILFTRRSGQRAPISSARTCAGIVRRSRASTGRTSSSPEAVCTSCGSNASGRH